MVGFLRCFDNRSAKCTDVFDEFNEKGDVIGFAKSQFFGRANSPPGSGGVAARPRNFAKLPYGAQTGWSSNSQNKFFVELSRPISQLLRPVGLALRAPSAPIEQAPQHFFGRVHPAEPGGEFARLRIDFLCKADLIHADRLSFPKESTVIKAAEFYATAVVIN
jgi:hypothetical protein